MFFKREHKLQRWVDAYVEERSRRYPLATSHQADWLKVFMKVCNKEITEIRPEDIEIFMQYVNQSHGTTYARREASRAASSFLRHWRARGHRYLPTAIGCYNSTYDNKTRSFTKF